jgi:hypothetical protein
LKTATRIRLGRDHQRLGGRPGLPGGRLAAGRDVRGDLAEQLRQRGPVEQDHRLALPTARRVLDRHGGEQHPVGVSAAQPVGQPAQLAGPEPVVDLQRAGGGVQDGVEPQRVQQRAAGGQLADHRGDEALLALDAVDVPARQARALPHEGQRLLAADRRDAGGQVDAGLGLARGPGQAHLHAVEVVDDLPEAVEVDLHVVVDAHPGQLLDRLDQQPRATQEERLVDLRLLGLPRPVVADVRRDLDPGVAGDADQLHDVGAAVQVRQHDDVGALTGDELVALALEGLALDLAAVEPTMSRVRGPLSVTGSASSPSTPVMRLMLPS